MNGAGSGSAARAVGWSVLGALVGVGCFLVLAIPFTMTVGLVVVGLFTGRIAGLLAKAGAAGTLSAPARNLVAVLVTLAAVLLANVAGWLVAGLQGGALSLPAYLDQVYGVALVALEFMAGTLAAVWSSR